MWGGILPVENLSKMLFDKHHQYQSVVVMIMSSSQPQIRGSHKAFSGAL